MNYLTDNEADYLLGQARLAMANTYSPYSLFPVGAAVLTHSGKVFLGTNVENASYGLTICAERIAIGAAITAGSKDLKAVAVWTTKTTDSPCGACRQFILEFGSDIIVIMRQNNIVMQKTIAELIPLGFNRDSML